MKKTIEIQGQRVELYSRDAGQTWSSHPQSIAPSEHRWQTLRVEILQKFARIDDMLESNRYRSRTSGMPNRASAR